MKIKEKLKCIEHLLGIWKEEFTKNLKLSLLTNFIMNQKDGENISRQQTMKLIKMRMIMQEIDRFKIVLQIRR